MSTRCSGNLGRRTLFTLSLAVAVAALPASPGWARVNPLRVLTAQAIPQVAVVFAYDPLNAVAKSEAAAVASALGLTESLAYCQNGWNDETCAGASAAALDCNDTACCGTQPICTRSLYLLVGTLAPAAAVSPFNRVTEARNYFERWIPMFQPDAGCVNRKRAVLLISDGTNLGLLPGDPFEAQAVAAVAGVYSTAIYNGGGGNPIQTFVAALPSTLAINKLHLDALADAGNNGASDSDAAAMTATSAAALVAAIKAKLENPALSHLYDGVRGDYAGSPSSANNIADDNKAMAITPSFEFPSWRGHLRAVDFSTVCDATTPCAVGTCVITPPATTGFCQVWDARDRLDTAVIPNHTRALYTGISGAPVQIATWNSGTSSWTANVVAVKSVWSSAGPALPPDPGVENTIKWIMDKSLGPIVNSVPATVSAPPSYVLGGDGTDHDQYAAARAHREPLIYVASNDGILHAFRVRNGDELFGYIPAEAWPKLYQLYQTGQAADPRQFIYVLANSPRVEDNRQTVNKNNATPPWRTDLLIPDGPADAKFSIGYGGATVYSGAYFSVLDISNPAECTAVCPVPPCEVDMKTCSTLTMSSPPFSIIVNSATIMKANEVVQEPWSLTSFFWTDTSYTLSADMGSGYRTLADMSKTYNEYFSYWHDLWAWPGTRATSSYQIAPDAAFMMPPAAPTMTSNAHNYAVLADVASIVDPDNSRLIVASYESTLNGTVVRFDKGDTAKVATIINAGPKQPFHFGAATLFRSGGAVTVAAVSGSAYEEHPYIWNPASGFESTIYLRRESGGTVDGSLDLLTKPISQLCTASANYVVDSATCVAPSARALPATDPVLIGDVDIGTDSFVELHLLYIDPPPSGTCGAPDSYYIVIRSDGAAQTVQKTVKFASSLLTGMTMLGGQNAMQTVFSSSAKGLNAAGAAKETSAPVGGATGSFGAPIVESWREVQ